jgi:hypothetical protein
MKTSFGTSTKRKANPLVSLLSFKKPRLDCLAFDDDLWFFAAEVLKEIVLTFRTAVIKESEGERDETRHWFISVKYAECYINGARDDHGDPTMEEMREKFGRVSDDDMAEYVKTLVDKVCGVDDAATNRFKRERDLKDLVWVVRCLIAPDEDVSDRHMWQLAYAMAIHFSSQDVYGDYRDEDSGSDEDGKNLRLGDEDDIDEEGDGPFADEECSDSDEEGDGPFADEEHTGRVNEKKHVKAFCDDPESRKPELEGVFETYEPGFIHNHEPLDKEALLNFCKRKSYSDISFMIKKEADSPFFGKGLHDLGCFPAIFTLETFLDNGDAMDRIARMFAALAMFDAKPDL